MSKLDKDCPKCTCPCGPFMQNLGMFAATAHHHKCNIWRKWYYEGYIPMIIKMKKDNGEFDDAFGRNILKRYKAMIKEYHASKA